MNALRRRSPLSPARAVALIGRGVLIETIRRKDFYVLFILSVALAVGMVVVSLVGIENASTASFLLNLGLTFASLSAHGLAAMTAARQIPAELDQRTLYPLLAKPLARGHYLLGKWLASTAIGGSAILILGGLVWIPAPRLSDFSLLLLFQATVLQVISIGLLSALALCLSLALPKGVNLVILGLVFFLGDKAVSFLRAAAAESHFADTLRWIGGYIPNFTQFDLLTRYTDGIAALSPSEFTGLILYGTILTGFSMLISSILFERRAL